MNVGRSHLALGVVCAGHPRVGDDFLPLAVLVEPTGGCTKERGYQKLSTWSLPGNFVQRYLCHLLVRPNLRLQQVSPRKPYADRPAIRAETSTTEDSRFSPASVDSVPHEVVRLRGEQILDQGTSSKKEKDNNCIYNVHGGGSWGRLAWHSEHEYS